MFVLKVLLDNSTFGGVSGSGRHVKYLVKALRGRVEFELWNVRSVGYLDVPKLRSLSFYLNCKRKQIPKDTDIVHVHNPKFAGLFNSGYANVLTVHGDYERELKIEYGRISKIITWYINVHVRNADIITTVSPYWAKIRGWLWIPNMIDIREIRNAEPASERYVLFVGRDDPVKDYPLFKRIAEIAYAKLGLKSLALGVRRHNTRYLKHNIVDWRKVISYMKSAHALIITSKQEGFPTVVLEAWASKCPVISRLIPPLKSLAKVNPGTILFYRDVKEAYEKIKKLSEDDILRSNIVKRGAKAVRSYDVPIVAEKYFKLYSILLKRRETLRSMVKGSD